MSVLANSLHNSASMHLL